MAGSSLDIVVMVLAMVRLPDVSARPTKTQLSRPSTFHHQKISLMSIKLNCPKIIWKSVFFADQETGSQGTKCKILINNYFNKLNNISPNMNLP